MSTTSTWQVQEAKQRFSELVERAMSDGPQIVTRHGRQVVVVLDIDEYRKLGGNDEDRFKSLLLEGPTWEDGDIVRSTAPTRFIEL